MGTIGTFKESSLLLGMMSQARLFQGARDASRPASNQAAFDALPVVPSPSEPRPLQPPEPR
ncbi:hypothetical protein LZ023_21370 [Pseudomonas silvicola]|nr:hypothetical protein LZ023_21370 [Pseudomonas silvicola]